MDSNFRESQLCNNLIASESTSNMSSARRFVYVKQNFIDSFTTGSTKVLINPNFKLKVHINPNFNARGSTEIKQNVYINPNIIQKKEEPPVCSVENYKKVPQNVYVNPNIIQRRKELPVCSGENNKNKLIVSTRTKLIRVPSKMPVKNKSTSLHSRYKIIRSVDTSSIETKSKIRKLYYIRSKYKIHKCAQRASESDKNFWRNPKFLYTTKLVTKNVIVKNKCNRNKSQYVNINGILYKKSPNTLKLARSINESIIRIRGLRYKMDSKQRTLKLLPSKSGNNNNWKQIHIGNVTFKRNDKNEFVRTTNKATLFKLSQAKSKSIQTLTNKMKKSNLPCPFYRKFGRCKGKEKGTCIRIHNPNQVSLCPKFLQGACVKEKCLLSHKVSAQKMPTCKFFLEGLCSKDNCQYLHVKINTKADICKDFLQGFCDKAEKCEKRHQFLCPEYEKKGTCSQKACSYPHGTLVRENKYLNKVATKSSNTLLKLKKVQKLENVQDKQLQEKHMLEKNARYYKDSEVSSNNEQSIEQTISMKETNLEAPKVRPKLGELPSFIPLFNQSS